MKIIGFTPLDNVPHWYATDEPRVVVPWPNKQTAGGAGLAASAGLSDREAGPHNSSSPPHRLPVVYSRTLYP
jgi:hypothetical protein